MLELESKRSDARPNLWHTTMNHFWKVLLGREGTQPSYCLRPGRGAQERPVNPVGAGLFVCIFGLHRNTSFWVKGQAVEGKAQHCHSVSLRMQVQDFPGGSVAKNLPAIARGTWVRSLVQKIPHAKEQLSPWTATAEPTRPRVRAPQQEKPKQHNCVC